MPERKSRHPSSDSTSDGGYDSISFANGEEARELFSRGAAVRLDAGLRDVEGGRTISQEEFDRRMAKWLAS